MKFLKIKEDLLEKIISGALNFITIIDDQDELAVDDQVEFINNDNVSFGDAYIDQVTIKRIGDIEDTDREVFNQTQVLIDNQAINDSSHVKIIHFHFNLYEEPRNVSNNNDLQLESVKIFTDGGSRGNPGPSASGYVIMTMNDEVIKSVGVYLGITTNNQAEYKALKFALSDAKALGTRNIEVYMDSLLVINQLKGVFKIKNRDLLPIYEEIRNLAKEFNNITYTHVPRELNKLADAEVNKCLDEQVN